MPPILILLLVLWFLSTQVSKVTSSVNKASSAVAPLGQVGGALTGAINAGAAAIGRFGGGGGGGGAPTSTSSPYTYGGVTYTTSGGAADQPGYGQFNPGVTPQTGVGSSSFTPYAPGASAPGPYAPTSGSAYSDDLMTPDYSDA